jgi:hypothetical protein
MDNNEKDNYDPFVGYVKQKFQEAETSRLQDEKRWLSAYRNYRGLYGPEQTFRDSEKSKVFVKVTKTKVLAAFGQLIEVLFSSRQVSNWCNTYINARRCSRICIT